MTQFIVVSDEVPEFPTSPRISAIYTLTYTFENVGEATRIDRLVAVMTEGICGALGRTRSPFAALNGRSGTPIVERAAPVVRAFPDPTSVKGESP